MGVGGGDFCLGVKAFVRVMPATRRAAAGGSESGAGKGAPASAKKTPTRGRGAGAGKEPEQRQENGKASSAKKGFNGRERQEKELDPPKNDVEAAERLLSRILDSPHTLLEPSEEDKTSILKANQLLYSYAWKHGASAASSGALEELVTEGCDSDQVWAQIELLQGREIQELKSTVGELMKNGGGNVVLVDDVDEDEDEDGDHDEDTDDFDEDEEDEDDMEGSSDEEAAEMAAKMRRRARGDDFEDEEDDDEEDEEDEEEDEDEEDDEDEDEEESEWATSTKGELSRATPPNTPALQTHPPNTPSRKTS